MSESGDESIQYEVDGPVATIWLNRPDVRNAVNGSMLALMHEAIRAACLNEAVRVIVYRGRGGNFCAGSDLGALDLDQLGSLQLSYDPEKSVGIPAVTSGLKYPDSTEIPKLTVAVIEGFAVGGGFELLVDADFAIAAEDARILDGHLRRGVTGGAGVLANLGRIVGTRRMMALVFGGRELSGREAEEWGLVTKAVPRDQLDDALKDLLTGILRLAPDTQRLAKLAYAHALDADKSTLAAMERLLVFGALNTGDAREGVASFLEKRPPAWVKDLDGWFGT